MKAILPCLGFAFAASVSSLLGQQPPTPAMDPGLRKLLDVPVWYFNYSVHLRLEHSGSMADGGSFSGVRDRFTSGRMMLGLRSSGPSLSAIANPRLMVLTTPDQIDQLVANYANWAHGPPPETDPDQELTDAERKQQDARFAQVRFDNVKAFHRHRYDYAANHSGGFDRTSASGSGEAMHAHEPALEFDAVGRRYRLMFAALNFVDSASTVNSFVGTRETGIGTIHYVRQEIKTGILTGDDGIATFQPPYGIIEGSLPATFGNIRHVATHQVTMRGGGSGTLNVQFTLSPDPPVPVEFIIEPPTDYVKWQPLGHDEEKTAGDSIPIKVVLQKVGGGPPPIKAIKYTYLLWKTSRELGVCLNWPPNPDQTLPFDLQFEQNANPHLLVVGNDRQVAVHAAPTSDTDTVTVSSFDFGAHGEFAAIAELENGQIVHGIVKFTSNQQELKLPFRPDGSLIASQFFDSHGLSGVKDDDDSERDPVGDGFTGDGLTLYEEYRGFMVGDAWTAGDPKKKEVFVMNELRGLPSTVRGIRLFESVTSFKVHDLLRENQVNGDGQINFLRTAGPHIVDQHAIRIQPGELVLLGNQTAQVTGDVGTPGTAKTVSIPPDLGIQLGAGYMASTLAHEMLHACNVYHHGENDRTVWWSYVPPGTQFFESDAVWDPRQGTLTGGANRVPITVKKEDGSVVVPAQFFPTGKTGGPIGLGMAHGQHSGHENCIMRYDVSMGYRSNRDASLRYLSPGETTGVALCTSPAGTGVNDAGRNAPEPRYLSAATAQNGGPGVTAKRGDCVHQIRVNDLATEPKR